MAMHLDRPIDWINKLETDVEVVSSVAHEDSHLPTTRQLMSARDGVQVRTEMHITHSIETHRPQHVRGVFIPRQILVLEKRPFGPLTGSCSDEAQQANAWLGGGFFGTFDIHVFVLFRPAPLLSCCLVACLPSLLRSKLILINTGFSLELNQITTRGQLETIR